MKNTFAACVIYSMLCALLCICFALPAHAAPEKAGTIVFCTKLDSNGIPVDPRTTFPANQKLLIVISIPAPDKPVQMELETRPFGTTSTFVWSAGQTMMPMDYLWTKPSIYTVTLSNKSTGQTLASGKVRIVAKPNGQQQTPPPALPKEQPQKQPEPQKPAAIDRPTIPSTPTPKVPVETTPAPPKISKKEPTSEAEEDLQPAPYFDYAAWVYFEDIPEKRWSKNQLYTINSDIDGLLITYSQITFKSGFYVGQTFTKRVNGNNKPYVRKHSRDVVGKITYNLDVADKYDRFRTTVGPGLWRAAPPNKKNFFGNVTILVDGATVYNKKFAWNSPNDVIDIDLSDAKKIQINMEGREFVVGDPYFRLKK